MTDEQALAVSYEALAMFEKEGDHRSMHHRFPEAAVRLGIVVPAQDGEGIKASAWRSSFLSVKAIIDEIGIILGGKVGDEVTVRDLARQRMAEAQDGEERLRAVYRAVMDLPTYKTPVGTTFVAREDVLKLLAAQENDHE